MNWTTTKPTREGWYWYRKSAHIDATEVVLVYAAEWNDGLLCVSFAGRDRDIPLSDVAGEYAGPLPKPAEAQSTQALTLNEAIDRYYANPSDENRALVARAASK